MSDRVPAVGEVLVVDVEVNRLSALREGPAPCGRTGERLGRMRPRSLAWSFAPRRTRMVA